MYNSSTQTAISIFKYNNIVCIIQVHRWRPVTNYGFIMYTNYGFIMYTQVRMTKLRIHKDYAAKAQARRNANDTRRPQWRTPRAHTIETKPESKLHETAEVRPQRRQLRRDRSKIHGDRSKIRLPTSVGPSRRVRLSYYRSICMRRRMAVDGRWQ